MGIITGFCATIFIELIALVVAVAQVDKAKNK